MSYPLVSQSPVVKSERPKRKPCSTIEIYEQPKMLLNEKLMMKSWRLVLRSLVNEIELLKVFKIFPLVNVG